MRRRLRVRLRGAEGRPTDSIGRVQLLRLPAVLVSFSATPRCGAVARDCCGGEFPAFTAIIRWPETRRWVNAHPIGVAILQAPFFVAAHGLTKWSNLSPDGFTLYYQHAVGLSGRVLDDRRPLGLRDICCAGTSATRVTAATLVALLFGTNLYHYATYDSSYSHAYSFFLFACVAAT